MPRPDQPSLPEGKPKTIAERAKEDFKEFYDHLCREDDGMLFYYLGWDERPPIQGHACRYRDRTTNAWGKVERIRACFLRSSVATALPGPAPEEKP